MQARHIFTLSGIAAVILLIAAFAVSGDSPGTGESAATVKAFYVDHHSGQQVGAYLLMIAVPLLVLFAAATRASLVASGTPANSLWGGIMLAGGAIAGTGFLLTACLQLALASSPKTFDGSAIQALNAVASYGWAAFTGGIGVLLLGAAGAMIPLSRGLRWLGWAGLALGILIFTPLGFFGFAASGLWVVVTSVALTMRGRSPQAARRDRVVTS